MFAIRKSQIMIGELLSPILTEIETKILEWEAAVSEKPEYTKEAFRAAIKIFMSTLLDKMWELQEKDNMDINTRQAMAEKAGNDIRDFVKTYTDIDTHELY